MRKEHSTQIIAAALLLLATACSGSAESADEGQPTTAPAQSNDQTEASEAATSPTAPASESSEGAVAGPRANCEYTSADRTEQMCTTAVFEPQLTFTLPEGWEPDASFPELPESSGYLKDDGSEVPPYLGFSRVPSVYEYPADGGTAQIADAPDDMVAFLAELPGTETTEPQQTTVAGLDATQIDFTVEDPPEAAPEGDCGGPPPPGIFVFNYGDECAGYFFPPNAEVRAVVVELAGEEQPLIITMEAGRDNREQAFADLDTVLASVEIGEGA